MEKLTVQKALEVILPKDAVEEMVALYGNPYDAFFNSAQEEWLQLDGFGRSNYNRLQAIRNLVDDLAYRKPKNTAQYKNPDIVFEAMKDMQYLDVEHVRVLYLNNKGCLIKDKTVSIGTINTAQLSTREIYSEAVKLKAASIILVHNHPSGETEASEPDKTMTAKVKKAGDLLGIPLLDHIIIGAGAYLSFANANLL